MDVYLRFVDALVFEEFIEVFLIPQDLFQIPPAVNAVLGGNIGDSFAIKWRMWIFYLTLRLQRWIPLCPRRTLVPKRRRAGDGGSTGGSFVTSLRFVGVLILAGMFSSCAPFINSSGHRRTGRRARPVLYHGKRTTLIGEVSSVFPKRATSS